MIKLPPDTAGRLLVLSHALLYVGIGIGLPLLLSHRPGSTSPNAILEAIGWLLLLLSLVSPIIIVSTVARRLRVKWWALYPIAAFALWPLGPFIGGLSLWDKRSNPTSA